MKALKWIAIVLGMLVVIVVLVLGWLGFMPGVSRYIGPRARDLGVELSTEQAYAAAAAHNMPTTRSDLEAIVANPESAKQVDTQLTSDEVSSLLVVGQEGIPSWPLRYVQIRFNDDGSAESSGYIWSGDIKGFLASMGVPAGDIDTALGRVPIMGTPPYYVAGTCSVSNNVVSLSLSEIQIGRLTVPASWYQGKEGYGTKYIDGTLASNGFQVDSLEIGSGTVNINGTRPLSSMEPWLNMVTSDSGGE